MRELFGCKGIQPDLDPKNIKVRESCDSDLNPLSTPIIVAVDDTGSMGFLAETLIRKGLGVLIEEIYKRKPVTDPHVMCMAVGDAWYDAAPLQATQFETDMRLVEQLSRFYIEGGGGGNNFESYNLPWYFAATRTRCDAFLKRQKKGHLFTVGDEPPPPGLPAKLARRIFGDELQADLTTAELFKMASEAWEIFHIIVEEGSYCRARSQHCKESWQKVLGQRAIPLADHTKLAELIVSTIAVNEGADLDDIATSWGDDASQVIANSLGSLMRLPAKAARGLIRF
jgi:hypothetical protein